MAQETSNFYRGLRRLFSNNVIVRYVGKKKLKVVDTDGFQLHNSSSNKYSRMKTYAKIEESSAAVQGAVDRQMLYNDYIEMDRDSILSCLSCDTKVATLSGNKTIRELSEQYNNGEKFEVWSWDNDECQYTIGQAHHPRKVGKKKVIELVFDNGEKLKCTPNHRILLVDGTYKQAGELVIDDSIMPFYYKNKNYMMIKTKNLKYKKVHRYIYENIFKKNIKGKAIHHINHNKYDNSTNNLKEMTMGDHARYHGKSIVTRERKKEAWTDQRKKDFGQSVKERFDDKGYKNKFSKIIKEMWSDNRLRDKLSKSVKKNWNDGEYREKALSGWRRWQTSPEGKQFMSEHSSKLNVKRWKNNEEYRTKMTKIFSDNAKKLWETPGFKEKFVEGKLKNLRLKMANDQNYTKRYALPGAKNGKFYQDIPNEKILLEGLKYNSIGEFINNFEFNREFKSKQIKRQFINRRLKQMGYNSFKNYKESYQYSNHKIVKIIDNNEEIDVYDLTVDFFENFCLKNGAIVSNSALDLYAEESTTKDEFDDILTIKTNNKNIEDILQNLFYDILNIPFNLWGWIRNMCKFGDCYLYLELHKDLGIVNVKVLSPYDIDRLEGADEDNPYLVQFVIAGDTKEMLEEFQIAHFRLLGDVFHYPYGKSMLEGGRKVWKQLTLMEDAMMIHRITRAPEKRVIKIDVGALAPDEIDDHMENIMNGMRRVPFIDQATGEYNLKYNIMNINEDFFFPVRGGDSGTEIETLSGMEYGIVEDIEYLQKKLFASLRIPKAFLSFEEGIGSKCLHPNTEIALLNGKTKTIKEIAELFENDKETNLWTYTFDFDTNSVIPTKIKLAEQTRKNAELVRVHIDNDTYVDCTPDHKFILNGGKEVQAQNLKNGDSLQIINRRKKKLAANANEYEQVYQPKTEKWEWTHSMVDEYINGKIKNNGWTDEGKFVRNDLTIRHHKDFNRFNNMPNNLKRMKFNEHIKLHQWEIYNGLLSPDSIKKAITTKRLPENRKISSDRQKKRIKDNPKLKNNLRDAWLNKTHEERSEVSKKGWANHPENIKERIKQNKLMGLAKKMRDALKVKYSNGRIDLQGDNNVRWIERPSFDEIVNFVIENKNKKDISTIYKLAKEFGVSKCILQEVIENNNYTCTEFMNYYWGFKRGRTNDIKLNNMIDLVSHYETKEMVFKNINVGKRWFNKVYKQYDLDNYTGINYNHKVVEVEWLTERINTYNMEVDNKNHNYLLGNGLVIKNSTLAAEDLRFSRTIERIQKIVVSELTKIAIIHLYSQGYKNKDLLDFELILSNPSVVHDEMKIELWNSKVSLARDMLDTNLLSSNFVYEQIFKLNQDDAETERLGVLEDKKRAFRYGSIEQEGSDPANQTPNKDDDGDEDDGFKWEDNSDNDDGNDSHETSGSSKKENSKIDTMLGVDDMKDAHKYDKNVINHKYKGGSALSLESIEADVFDENDEEINANKSLIQKRIADKYNFLERLDATLQYAKKESDKNLIKEVLKMKKIK